MRLTKKFREHKPNLDYKSQQWRQITSAEIGYIIGVNNKWYATLRLISVRYCIEDVSIIVFN